MFEPDTIWEFSTANNVTFGAGAVTEFSATVERFDAESVLVVTDQGIVDNGIHEPIVAQLEDVEYRLHADVESDPSVSHFEAAIEAARDQDPDLIVGVGGGSTIDVAKTTSVVAAHGGDVLGYVAEPTGDGQAIPGPGIPTVAVPTTAGTGSETSPVSVLSIPGKKLKAGISSDYQRPNVALIDPELAVSLPSELAAITGIDALSHAVEAYLTRPFDAKPAPATPTDRPDYGGRTLLTDRLAETAIELVGQNLRTAVHTGDNLDARREMALASFLAGAAFTNAGLGATHAMALAVSGEYGTPHGLAIATLLPAVVEYNAGAAPERCREIARLLGKPGEDPTEAADAIRALREDLDVTDDLSDLGASSEDVDGLASNAATLQRLLDGNPRSIDEDDLVALFRETL